MITHRTDRRDNVPAARELRTRQTPAEAVLWEALRNRRLAGLKFRRQHPVGPFVLDFCCPDRRLAIELDGAVHAEQREHDAAVHAEQREHDAEREALLATAGYRVLRFTNDAVRDDLATVLEAIRATAAHERPRPAQSVSRTAGW